MTTPSPNRLPEALPLPILVVDDDAVIRRLFCRALQRSGFATVEAADGREALDAVAKRPVSLVILDSQMPHVGGREVLAALRSAERTRRLPVILVTGRTDVSDRVAGLAAGADDYVTKPVSLDELVARVRAQLRATDAWREVLERSAQERHAVSRALRNVRTEVTPQQTAQSMIDQLSGVLGPVPLAILRFGGSSAVPLASTGALATVFPTGRRLPTSVAEGLVLRSREGPWIQRWPRHVHDDEWAVSVIEAGVRAAAFAPLRYTDNVIGILAMAEGEASIDPQEMLAERLPALIDFADLAGALLAAVVNQYERDDDDRLTITDILETHAFRPVFQPIVSLGEGETVGWEALTRFHDGTRPDIRFQQAAAVGLGLELERACLTASVEASEQLPSDGWLSLNVSPAFVLSGQLAPILEDVTRPIVLELTEHAPVSDYGEIRRAIRTLGRDVRIAVDDAGAGFASLRHILELGPELVKLDIALVRSVDSDPARQALIAGMGYFVGTTNRQIIAEGIETDEELDTLRGLRVALGQGFLLGRPASAEQSGGVCAEG